MKFNFKLSSIAIVSGMLFSFVLCSCSNTNSKAGADTESKVSDKNKKKYPSDVMPYMDKWKILLGDGTNVDNLIDYEKEGFFYVANDGKTDWVAYKTPNSGITSRTSSNTRTELGQKEHWTAKIGGKLSSTVKVMHVSTSGDARVAASYSTVIGQIHSDTGHENEPLKIFYKKFPGHTKGSVFWNYEINTEGDNAKRWDFSTAVWGHDMSVIGTDVSSYPEEPSDGIALGEEFSYEINVYDGIMYLSFSRDGQAPKTFTKNLIVSEYINDSDIPEQIRRLFAVIDRDGTEKPSAYEGESQYFKQGAYNQTNGKAPETNMVWSTGSKIYDGDLAKQYANGSYTEIWFRDGKVGPGSPPKKQ